MHTWDIGELLQVRDPGSRSLIGLKLKACLHDADGTLH